MRYVSVPLLAIAVLALSGRCTRPVDEPIVTPPAEPREVSTFAGSGKLGDRDGQADSAQFCFPQALAFSPTGTLYIADNTNDLIRAVDVNQVVTTLAGAGYVRYHHDPVNGQGRKASFNGLTDIAFGADGNCYAVEYTSQVRKITPDGQVSTFTVLPRGYGNGLTFDASGNLYVSTTTCLYKISPAGKVSLFSGQPGVPRGFRDGDADSARFVNPASLASDQRGNLYVADMNLIRKVAPDGSVTTFAGYEKAVADKDGVGTAAGFGFINGLAIGALGDLYVSTFDAIRKVTPDGVVTTVAGGVNLGYQDGSLATARFNQLNGIAFDRAGNLYAADRFNRVVRKIVLR
ncbi:NHL domain-containing protein [Spirosoma rhododendri]|uniref:Teneurin NHL domain-containing protein n=1 Tax=Spirosoma rhododendri TaxID=2728024 RepID=A0A7L5DJ27_9BACT|nr:hypothetical protein [Spirosoma rhododendri]QJD77113.1 hypothetical protein HH216_00785 [Spirosoma rhododendri]